MMLAAMQPAPSHQSVIQIPAALSAASPSQGPRGKTRVILDSGNLTYAHLVSDKSLFSNYSTNVESVPVMVANRGVVWTVGGGDCNMQCYERDSDKWLGCLSLRGCKYIPPESFGVNLISVQRAWSDGISIRFEDVNAVTTNGVRIPFRSDDYSLYVSSEGVGENSIDSASPAVITRGKHGPTHIGVDTLTDKQRLEIKLWSARLNDLTAKNLRHIHHIVDGVPKILTRADIHNTLSDSRLLANGPRHTARSRKPDDNIVPGQYTSFVGTMHWDLWAHWNHWWC